MMCKSTHKLSLFTFSYHTVRQITWRLKSKTFQTLRYNGLLKRLCLTYFSFSMKQWRSQKHVQIFWKLPCKHQIGSQWSSEIVTFYAVQLSQVFPHFVTSILSLILPCAKIALTALSSCHNVIRHVVCECSTGDAAAQGSGKMPSFVPLLLRKETLFLHASSFPLVKQQF